MDCLGSIWTQRHKKGREHLSPTVRATIAHFNRVANMVITTCLGDQSMKAKDRATVLEHWVKVAKVSCGRTQVILPLETWDLPLLHHLSGC